MFRWVSVFISSLFLVLSFQSFAEESGKEKKETPETQNVVEKVEEEKSENKSVEVKKWFLGASMSYLAFDTVSSDLDEIDYNIDQNLWTTLTGSYKFKKGLSAMLNVNIDTADAKRGLDILGQFAKDNIIVQVTSGKFTGDATVTSELVNNSYTQTANDISTNYLAIDFLHRKWFSCEGCISGIRYLQYELPSVIGVRSSDISGQFSASGSVLDPELAFKGLMFVASFSTQRDFVLGANGEAVEKQASLPPGFAGGATSISKLGHTVAIGGHVGLGGGSASVSDAGKANVISAAAGKTLEEDSKFVLLYEVSVSFLWAYNKMLDNGNRWSVGLGYDYRISASLSKLSFDDPADPNQVAFSDVSVGYIQHGPVANFYYVF